MTQTYTTQPIDSIFGTATALDGFLDVTTTEDGFTVTFTDTDKALKALTRAKTKAWGDYLRNGGNPRNKRSFGSQYAAVTKAIRKAAAAD